MATYYGYKEREDPKKSMIDWASITKDITEGLYAEGRRREEEKSTLEQDYVKQLNDLNQYTQGLDPTLNQAMLGYVQNYRNYLLENHKMMKAGVVSVNDSKIAKQGASDSFKNLNTMVTSINGEVQKLIEAGGDRNEFIAQLAANSLDFKNQQLLIDQKSGTGSFARLNEDGTINKDTIVPFAASGQMFQPVKQVDINVELNNATKDLGKLVKANNAYYSLSDIRQNKEDYDKWKTSTMDAMLSGDKLYAVAEALGYGVGDVAEGKTMRGVSKDGRVQFELTDDQVKEIRNELSSMIEVRVDSEEKRSAPSNVDQLNASNRKNQMQTANSLIKYLKTGDQPIGAGIIGSEAAENITAIKINKDGGVGSVTLSDGRTISTNLKNKDQKEISVGDLFVSIAPNLGISPDVADEMVEAQGLMDIPLAEAYPDLVKTDKKFTFVTQENMEALNTSIDAASKGDYTNVLMQLNAIGTPKGLPTLKLKDGTKVYYENASGQPILMGDITDPGTVLKSMDSKIGKNSKTAKGDAIFQNKSEVKEE